jgi:hypothetical protein
MLQLRGEAYFRPQFAVMRDQTPYSAKELSPAQG